MTGPKNKQLIIIGGHEDKEGDQVILRAVAEAAGKNGQIAVGTVATRLPEEVAKNYREVFGELGVANVVAVDVRTRDQANEEELVAQIASANVIFFTGGDQLRITSQIGDSALFRCMRQRYAEGVTIVGTSAGAAAMSETMLVAGPSDTSARIADISMAPGLALLENVVIDSHFAERGRIGRLLGAAAQNPRNLGLGIDEDTAIIVHDHQFEVLGTGAVYVADGTRITYSSLSDKRRGVLSMADVTLHILGNGAVFDLETRRPDFSAYEQKQEKS